MPTASIPITLGVTGFGQRHGRQGCRIASSMPSKGHAPRTDGENYGTVILPTMFDAIKKVHPAAIRGRNQRGTHEGHERHETSVS